MTLLLFQQIGQFNPATISSAFYVDRSREPPFIIFYTIILCASSPLYIYIVPYIGKI